MHRQPQRVFPLSRYFHFEHFRHYYPFGNAPAEDLLQSVAVSECRRPTILSLGCGDMRSCMYTIWKNFGFEGGNSNGFNGVDFVLNDYNASVLARNILFLHLCMRMPDDEVSRKEWIASMWSLWYNHELQPQHATMLSDALAQLVQWSHTWQEWSECPLGRVVRFSSPAIFVTVKKLWNKWNSPMEQSVDKLKLERNSFQYRHVKKYGENETKEEGLKTIGRTEFNLFLLRSIRLFHSSKMIGIMEKEYLHYLMEGTVWVESILGIPSSTLKTVVNPTLIERQDGMYTLHYTLAPYSGFIHSFQYTHAEICRTLGRGSGLLQFLPVDDNHFKGAPLLANSVQQFAMWSIATAHMMRRSSRTDERVLFVFDLDDAMNLCHFLYHQPEKYSKLLGRVAKFDAIYTSNLFDHLSPPALVLSSLPLLKPSGTLFTVTFRHKAIASTSREYLEAMFGFSPELFPALLGIHCLGEDGEYSPAVNNEPSPDYAFTDRKTFIWRNIKSQSLAIDTIEESPHATMSLLKICIISSLQPLTAVGSVESFLVVLHQFLKQLPSSFASTHHCLNSLSSAIQNEAVLKPYLLQIQTQSLLHGVHMHITLTEDNCPLCRGQPLETYLQQFTVSFDITTKARVYDVPSFSINLASPFGDCAVITSIACRSVGPTLALDFYLPKQCLSQYTWFRVHINYATVIEGSMNELESSSNEYIFLKQPCATEKPSNECPLGNIVKHIGDESTFETVVSINEACQMALQTSKLDAKCNEFNQLTLVCGALSGTIVYPYAINESKTHIKISRKRNIIFVTVKHEGHLFYKETPTFYVDPSNKLAVPRFQCRVEAMNTYCNLQLPLISPDHPLFNAKQSFIELFKHALCGDKYFALSFPSKRIVGTPDVHALVYVHDVRFSTAFSSPVLDVSYCFLDTKPMHLLPDFSIMQNSLGSTRSIMVNDAEYKLLKEIFNYFSTVTCCAFSTERHTVTLPVESDRLWKYFDHAIIFPLYPNPANPKAQKFQPISRSMQHPMASRIPKPGTVTASQEHLTQTELRKMSKCSFCSQFSAVLKKCAHCHKVEYCGRECQLKHWPMHKSACKASDTNPENSTPTQNGSPQTQGKLSNASEEKLHKPSPVVPSSKEQSYGNSSESDASHTISAVCMRCEKPATINCSCGSVSYCSKPCQTLEWPEHSEKCNLPVNRSSPTDSSCKDLPHSKDNREPTATPNLKCSNCNKIKLQLKCCSKCRNVSYCSVECQRLDWPQHKYNCSAVRK